MARAQTRPGGGIRPRNRCPYSIPRGNALRAGLRLTAIGPRIRETHRNHESLNSDLSIRKLKGRLSDLASKPVFRRGKFVWIQFWLASILEPSQFLSFCVIAAATKKRCLPSQRSPRIARVSIPLSALGFETHAAASRLSEKIRPA